ncbi:MAG: hypothetical protein AUI50_02060 [Crenarchaeota archaeon 13_1_40CM_2_52_14]|nr:MAG: hypothetical protein AUI97_06215 [Crenarchaeota archaeon 13_1_40CM_3_52_17]OLD35503.1 MAG: hypothetical protein AUI50_02060 [Crenarchaeota archaeon 13_1_40CM_2_52_14]OLE70608.1 MAG: hypothetical protein AUF78_05655 [archaeon 13_1_20CM_2_51_12]
MPKLLVLYMSRKDEDDFLEYVRSLGNLLILPGTSPGSDFAPVDSLPEPSQDESTRRFWLQYTSSGIPLVTEQVPEKGLFVVDGFQSPVIEFWRSWMVSQVMLPGGIQTDMNYVDDERHDLAKKPAEFRNWFGSIDGWIRKNYTRLGIYIFLGPGARKFREEGGILQGR